MFERWQGPSNGALWFYKCRFSGGETTKRLVHSNPTLCKKAKTEHEYSLPNHLVQLSPPNFWGEHISSFFDFQIFAPSSQTVWMAPLVLMERKPTAVSVTRVTTETIVNMVNTLDLNLREIIVFYPINWNLVLPRMHCFCKIIHLNLSTHAIKMCSYSMCSQLRWNLDSTHFMDWAFSCKVLEFWHSGMPVADGRNCTDYLQWLDFRKGILNSLPSSKTKALRMGYIGIIFFIMTGKVVSPVIGKHGSVYQHFTKTVGWPGYQYRGLHGPAGQMRGIRGCSQFLDQAGWLFWLWWHHLILDTK